MQLCYVRYNNECSNEVTPVTSLDHFHHLRTQYHLLRGKRDGGEIGERGGREEGGEEERREGRERGERRGREEGEEKRRMEEGYVQEKERWEERL